MCLRHTVCVCWSTSSRVKRAEMLGQAVPCHRESMAPSIVLSLIQGPARCGRAHVTASDEHQNRRQPGVTRRQVRKDRPMMTSEAPEGTSSANGKNRWFQLGLVSAGAAAPLIARWRSLRAAEQAEALREQASARWSDAVERVVSSLPQEAIQETVRQALPQAQESLRQVGSAARTALQRLPAVNLSTPEPVVIAAPRSTRRV